MDARTNLDDLAAAQVLAMLGTRDAGATLCPSEVARALAGTRGDWRACMGKVHAAVDRLLGAGRVVLSWQGSRLKERRGPYRIGRAP